MRRAFMAFPFVLALGLGTGASGQTLTARVAVIEPPDKPMAVMWQNFARIVGEKTQGRVDIKVFASGQLGSEKEIAEGIRLGAVQGGSITLAALSSWVPQGELFDLPFLFRDAAHIERVMTGPIGRKHAAHYPPQGFRLLGYTNYGARNPVATFPVTTPGDIKGKKFRTLQSPLHIDLWRTLGANPTPIPILETYNALQTGTVDLMDTTDTGFENLKLYEVAPYFVQVRHIWALGGMVIAESFWKRLSAEQQAVMQAAAAEVIPVMNRELAASAAAALERSVAKGGKVSAPDQGPWRAAMTPFWEKYAAKVGGMTAIREIVDTP